MAGAQSFAGVSKAYGQVSKNRLRPAPAHELAEAHGAPETHGEDLFEHKRTTSKHVCARHRLAWPLPRALSWSG
eukprot:3815763-Amphidinium_carterae.2